MTKIKIEGAHFLRDAIDQQRPVLEKAMADAFKKVTLCILYGCVYRNRKVRTPCTRCGVTRPDFRRLRGRSVIQRKQHVSERR